MSVGLFESKKEVEAFKQKLIHYSNLKKASEIIVNLLSQATLEFVWFGHNNWNNGVDLYELNINIPIELYARLEDKLDSIGQKINISVNHLIKGNNQINAVNIDIQEDFIEKPSNKNILAIVEKIKNLLLAKATGEKPDENEYRKYRTALLAESNLKQLIPVFILHYSNLSEFWIYIKPKFPTYKLRREHIIEEFKPLICFIESPYQNPIHANTKNILAKLNSDSVHECWRKAIDRVNINDLDGAITIARTLLENVIKQMLNDLYVEYDDGGDDLIDLYKKLADELKLSPGQYNEKIFKQILGGCWSVVQGLGSLRNKIGDAHAQGKKTAKPARRHAELAVNLAGSMAVFLISTWENNSLKETRKSPVA